MSKNNILFKPLTFIGIYKDTNFGKYQADTPFGYYTIHCILDDMIKYKIFDIYGDDISPDSLLSFEMAEKICGEHFKELLRRCVDYVKVESCKECSDRMWMATENRRNNHQDNYGWK